MTPTTTPYPLQAIRTLALHCQGLTARNGTGPTPTPPVIYNTVDQIGCVQIDTLQMVQRSQYLVVWSRLGLYDPADFDRLIYGTPAAADGQNDRRLFEYWLHAASIIPLTEFRYRLPVMRYYQETAGSWNERWLSQPENAALMDEVYDRIRAEGARRTGDFQDEPSRSGSWWGWKPAKRALEVLYDRGQLMIADRINFQRVYDLRERVLPDWVDTTPPTDEDAQRHWLERGARCFGICQPLQTADYAYYKRTDIRPMVDDLIAEGVFMAVEAELAGGQTDTLIVHRDHLPLLHQAADGSLVAERTTFLSPFDNLFWPKDRDVQFWNFRQVLEAYKPADQRQWGYFCLPILHRDRLVGRFDPKLERKTGTLRLKALYLEPGVAPDEELIADIAGAMRDFLAFHRASALVIERSDPPELGDRLLAAL